MRNPLHAAFEKLDKAIKEGRITRQEIEQQAKKHKGCFADLYLKSRRSES